MNIQEYLTGSVENIMKSAVRVALTNPVQSIFMARFALAVRSASEKRLNLEKAGEHVPDFLIASITSRCNLHCAGCYAREFIPVKTKNLSCSFLQMNGIIFLKMQKRWE